eukprot:6789117-Alexandrium_andersonii.AAC.1
MSASLVGSEMCIRDSIPSLARAPSAALPPAGPGGRRWWARTPGPCLGGRGKGGCGGALRQLLAQALG